MDSVQWYAPIGQARPEIAEEARWPANVEVAISWNAELVENLHPQMTGRVVVPPLSIICSGPAVADPTSPPGKHTEKLSHLRGEYMGFSIACTVEPPDLPRRSARS